MNQASAALTLASSQADESARAVTSYNVLKFSIQAKEQMTVEAARQDIPKRETNLKVVVHNQAGKPVKGASVAYSQKKLDFVLTYGQGAPFNPFPYPSYRAGAETGYQSLNIVVTWNQISPKKGVKHFSRVDATIRQLKDMGYDTTITLAWLGTGNVPSWAQNLKLADFQQQLGLFIKATVKHFAPTVKYMLPAPEMNLQTITGSRYVSVAYQSNYLTGMQPADLIKLLRTVFQAGRSAHTNMLLGYYGIDDYDYNVLNPLPFGTWPTSYSLLKSLLKSDVKPDFIGIETYPGTCSIPRDLSSHRRHFPGLPRPERFAGRRGRVDELFLPGGGLRRYRPGSECILACRPDRG